VHSPWRFSGHRRFIVFHIRFNADHLSRSISLFLLGHLMGFDGFPVALCVELKCEKETGFQLPGRARVTRRVKDCGVGVSPVALMEGKAIATEAREADLEKQLRP
jgi:hypothetical protein